MKLVIDIPEEDYIRLRDEGMFGNVTTFKRAVREGIPLEQEPCEDAISRQAVLDTLDAYEAAELSNHVSAVLRNEIKSLPSVKPNYTDAEIQKMQDLEFAEIQKAYEIGKDEGSSENSNKWIPVSERLPEDGSYLAAVKSIVGEPRISIRSFAKDLNKVDKFDFPKHKCGWYGYDSEYGYWEDTDVVAWMPLPKPYVPDTNIGKMLEIPTGEEVEE